MTTPNDDKYGERLVRLESNLMHLEADVLTIRDDVRQLRDALLQGKGSWKTAAALIGLAGSIIVTVVAGWLTTMSGTPK